MSDTEAKPGSVLEAIRELEAEDAAKDKIPAGVTPTGKPMFKGDESQNQVYRRLQRPPAKTVGPQKRDFVDQTAGMQDANKQGTLKARSGR